MRNLYFEVCKLGFCFKGKSCCVKDNKYFDLFSRNLNLYVLCINGHEQIADLSMLRAGMPKFESHYIDNLVGKPFGNFFSLSNYI